MKESTNLKGHCYCGDVSFEITGDPVRVAHCHCESCRRSVGVAMVTSAGFLLDQISFTGNLPSIFTNDDGVSRGFCGRCGSSVSYHRSDSAYTFVYLGLFNEPEKFVPEVHMMYSEKIDWLRVDDNLPKSNDFS